MKPSKAKTVEAYLSELPTDRREALSAVRDVIRRNMDKDIEEGMQYGMIGYYVPHRVFEAGYHCDPSQPLPYASLASQKAHMSLYLMSAYLGAEQLAWLEREWLKRGKKLNMGKACIRFKKLDDLPLDVIGEAIRRVPAKQYVERYESILATMKRGRTSKPARTKAPAKKMATKRSAGASASRNSSARSRTKSGR